MNHQQKTFHRTNLEGQRKMGKRSVILHFHTFKNAGSTVDAFLQKCFPDAWANYDGPVPEFFIHHSEIAIIARNRAQLKAISSHQIRLPVPEFHGIEFLPIVFIRRPELRIASIWRFQRQRRDDHPATILAQKYNLRDWIKRGLQQTVPNATRNAQAQLFCYDIDKRNRLKEPGSIERAIRNIESLQIVGIVEDFHNSMYAFEDIYSKKIKEFKYTNVKPKNVTSKSDESIDMKIEKLRSEIGNSLYDEVIEENSLDLKLYNIAIEKLKKHKISKSLLNINK